MRDWEAVRFGELLKVERSGMSGTAVVKENVELAVSDGTRMTAYVALPERDGVHRGLLVLQEALEFLPS